MPALRRDDSSLKQALDGSLRHLFYFWTGLTSVVSGATTAWSDSKIQTPGEISNAYSSAVRRTYWMHDSLPVSLQGREVWSGWWKKLDDEDELRREEKWWMDRSEEKEKFFFAYLCGRALRKRKERRNKESYHSERLSWSWANIKCQNKWCEEPRKFDERTTWTKATTTKSRSKAVVIALLTSTLVEGEPAAPIKCIPSLGASCTVCFGRMSVSFIDQTVIFGGKGAEFIWFNMSCMKQSWMGKWWRCVSKSSYHSIKGLKVAFR